MGKNAIRWGQQGPLTERAGAAGAISDAAMAGEDGAQGRITDAGNVKAGESGAQGGITDTGNAKADENGAQGDTDEASETDGSQDAIASKWKGSQTQEEAVTETLADKAQTQDTASASKKSKEERTHRKAAKAKGRADRAEGEIHEKIKFTHSLFFQVFMYFAMILSVFATLIAVIFMELYKRNMIVSFEGQLLSQAQQLSSNVSTYSANDDIDRFNSYIIPWQEMLGIEGTDIWILQNPGSAAPISSDFVNVNIEGMELSDDMRSAIGSAIEGYSGCVRSYDPIYGKTIIRASTPIRDANGAVVGALLLNNYADLQERVNDNSASLIFTSILLALMISFVIAILFARQLSRPISQMRKVAFQYADGNYDYPINVHRKDEIGELAAALDVLSRKLTENEKERQYLEQMRQDFFANVSHELRTPITVIRGYAETLSDGVVTDPKKVSEYYQHILRECSGMERLVSDLLLLAKMQNPEFQVEKEPVNLIQVFDDLLRSAQVLCAQKGILLDFQKDADYILILGDYDRLRQMFLVILDNAMKFSPEGSTIHIRVASQDKIQVSIQDEGIGIAKEELPYIFEKFYKSKLRQNATGSGLGLMIAKQIALKHGGEIHVESTLGKGTTFLFTFEKEAVMP